MKKKNKKVKEQSVEDIEVYWSILDGWNDLPYDKKLEYYWRYEYKDGKRVMPDGTS
jgi:hypothetical protein